MDLLEVVVAVEEREASDEGHHHKLHSCPRRLGRLVLTSTGLGTVEAILTSTITVFAPNCEDTDKEGQCSHNDLPRLGRTELSVASEHFSDPRC